MRLATMILICFLIGCSQPADELPSSDHVEATAAEVIHRFDPVGSSDDLLCAIAAELGAAETAPASLEDRIWDWSCGDDVAFHHVEFGRDRRRSVLIPAGRTLDLSVQGGGHLRFSGRGLEPGSTFLSVAARATWDTPIVNDRGSRSWLQQVPAKGPWVDGALDLSIFRDRTVTLRISTQGGPVAFANPRRIVRERSGDRPAANVLVYLVDTLRPDRMSIHGHDRETTPRIDATFADGLIFERVWATSAWTRPSTASVLTSLYPSFHRVDSQAGLGASATTIAERFRHAGWSTWAFVANGNVHGRGLGFEQGFDRFLAIPGVRRDNHAHSEEINEVVFEHLDRFGDEPFFLFVHAVDPHSPYDPPGGFRGRFTDPDYAGEVVPARTKKKELGKMELSAADVAQVQDLYDEDLLYQDAMFGALLDGLDERGLGDDLVVVLVSDHGEEFGEHGGWEHGKRLWEEQTRVPLLIRPPVGVQLGGRFQAPAQIVDIMPTLLGWFGIPGADLGQGQSLDGAIAGDWDQERLIYSEELRPESGFELVSLRQGDLKVVLRRDLKGLRKRWTLWDLAADPGEQTDLADSDRGRFAPLREALEDRPRRLGERADAIADRVAAELDEETLEQLRALGYLQ